MILMWMGLNCNAIIFRPILTILTKYSIKTSTTSKASMCILMGYPITNVI